MIDIVNTGAPGVNFQHISLHEIDEATKVVDDDGFFSLAILLLHMSDLDGICEPREGMLLIKAVAAVAIRASHEGKRPASNKGKDGIGHLGVIFGEA